MKVVFIWAGQQILLALLSLYTKKTFLGKKFLSRSFQTISHVKKAYLPCENCQVFQLQMKEEKTFCNVRVLNLQSRD